MEGNRKLISPFHRPRCLAAAAPGGKAKLTHPGKAILAGKFCNPLFRHHLCQYIWFYIFVIHGLMLLLDRESAWMEHQPVE